MARVITQTEAKNLGLPGRKSLEIMSGEQGSRQVTLRLVEIPVPVPDEPLRGPHHHDGFEECILYSPARVARRQDPTGIH